MYLRFWISFHYIICIPKFEKGETALFQGKIILGLILDILIKGSASVLHYLINFTQNPSSN